MSDFCVADLANSRNRGTDHDFFAAYGPESLRCTGKMNSKKKPGVSRAFLESICN